MIEPTPLPVIDAPPCVNCTHYRQCKRERLACEVFLRYVYDWKTDGTGRDDHVPRCIVPNKSVFRKLFRVRCQHRRCAALCDPSSRGYRYWGTAYRDGDLIDLCPKHLPKSRRTE